MQCSLDPDFYRLRDKYDNVHLGERPLENTLYWQTFLILQSRSALEQIRTVLYHCESVALVD